MSIALHPKQCGANAHADSVAMESTCVCDPGHELGEQGVCEECPSGMFSEYDGGARRCKRCTELGPNKISNETVGVGDACYECPVGFKPNAPLLDRCVEAAAEPILSRVHVINQAPAVSPQLVNRCEPAAALLGVT